MRKGGEIVSEKCKYNWWHSFAFCVYLVIIICTLGYKVMDVQDTLDRIEVRIESISTNQKLIKEWVEKRG